MMAAARRYLLRGMLAAQLTRALSAMLMMLKPHAFATQPHLSTGIAV